MSFASTIKKEMTQIENIDCCNRAELGALIRMNGLHSVHDYDHILDIQTENAAIARRIYTLIKSLFPYPIKLVVRKKMKLKKNNIYIVRINDGVEDILKTLDLLLENPSMNRSISKQLVKKDCCKRAYLRGAFLAGGSVNNPETSSYHLEISNAYEDHNDSLCELMNSYNMRARTLVRRNGFITYIKEAEKITEFLNYTGAHQALFKFEDVRIIRDMRNSVNRLVNCETANLNKTISAAFRQVENIKFIDQAVGLHTLPHKLLEIAKLRLENQDVSLKELGELMPNEKISKSGINHRLKKIDKIADQLRQQHGLYSN